MNTHNKDNVVAFLEKVKKQAKKILKLSKENGLKLEIKNLSDAQDLIAKANGYPNWHSLSNNLGKEQINDIIENNSLQLTSEENILLSELNGLYVIENETHLTSFFELTEFPLSSITQIENWVSEFKKKIAFKWNMKFHEIHILLNFSEQKNLPNEKHTFFEWSDSLGINKEQFNELFSIDLIPQSTEFGLQVICAACTLKDQVDEHISFCKEFKNSFVNKSEISKSQYDLLKFPYDGKTTHLNSDKTNSLKNLVLNSGITKAEEENLNWFYGLQFLYQKRTPIKLVASFLNGQQILNVITEENASNSYINSLKGIWTSLNQQTYGHLSIDEPMSLTPIKNQKLEQFKQGVPFLNKTDGNIINIRINNHKQSNNNNFIYAPPGFGKSTLMNALQLDNILESGKNGELSFTGIVDIGPSSRGIIDFLKHNLKPKLKEQVVYHKLSKSDVINPFETELGCRYPTHTQKTFLEDFIYLTLLTTYLSESDKDVLRSYVRAFVPIVYDSLSDSGEPSRYDMGVNKDIDSLLKEINYETNRETTWWNVVDALFNAGLINHAKEAQRYANPYFINLNSAIQDSKLRDIYRSVLLSNSESINQYVCRILAYVLKTYPVFQNQKSLDFGNAKILSIDLEDVCSSGGEGAEHASAIYYSLASFVVTKQSKFYLKSLESDQHIIPDNFKDYYKKEIKNYWYKINSVCFDEYHRVSKYMDNIITSFMRESRKHYFSFTVASQLISHRNDFIEYCANKFIYAKDFKNNDFANYYLKDRNFLVNKKINSMDILLISENSKEKIISLKINPTISWILTNTMEDSLLKEMMIENMGYMNAIQFLTNKYPFGVKAEIEEMLEMNRELSRRNAVLELFKQIKR